MKVQALDLFGRHEAGKDEPFREDRLTLLRLNHYGRFRSDVSIRDIDLVGHQR